MKSLTTTALVAIVAGTIGFAALTPAAFAQQGPNQGQPGQHMQGQMPGPFGKDNSNGRMRNARGPGSQGGLLALVCNDNGAERAEIGFVRLAYRLDLTAEQQALFDDLKSSALTAQTQFADQCAKPAEPMANAEPTPPNPVERLTTQIGNDKLRLDLMEGLLPKLQAFYDSLTDAQKASLQPQRGRDGQGFRRHQGELPGEPGQPEDPAAPAEAAPAAFLIG